MDHEAHLSYRTPEGHQCLGSYIEGSGGILGVLVEQLRWVKRTEEGGMNSLCVLTESYGRVQRKMGMYDVGKSGEWCPRSVWLNSSAFFQTI